MSNPFDDPEIKAFFERAKKEMFPKLKTSAMSISILDRSHDPEPQFCLELGAAIMFEKPIIFLVLNPTDPIPEALRKCAAAIVYGRPSDPNTQIELQKAISKVIGKK